ncbi:hypothetical protein ACFLSA_02670 [Bacteroidota bacterium]
MNIEKHPLYKKMDPDTVLSETFQIYFSNFRFIFLLSLIFSLLMQLPVYLIDLSSINQTINSENWLEALEIVRQLGFIGIFAFLIFVLYVILISEYILSYYEDKSKMANRLIEALRISYLPAILLIIISGIIFSIGMIIGVFIFIIGILIAMFYLFTAISPIIPILLNESKNPFTVLGKSFNLIHTNFWNSLGTASLMLIVYIIISLILVAVSLIPMGIETFIAIIQGNNLKEYLQSPEFFTFSTGPVQLVISSLINALLLPLLPIFGVIFYLKLKFEQKQSDDFSTEEYIYTN